MSSFKKRKRRILPKYAYLPIIIALLWNELVYHVTKLINADFHHHDFTSSIDKLIPYTSPFIVIYILAYVLWGVGFVIFARENRRLCNEMFAAEIIAEAVCALFFIFLPTSMVRADISTGGFFNWLTGLMYTVDKPNNLFPSIHCMESWLCFRGAFKCKKIHFVYSVAWFVTATLICMSTVFVKQHVFVDIFAGIIVAEIGLYISRWFNAGVLFDIARSKLIKLRKYVRTKRD